MNIQRKNSAHHFHMQSEREQTLVITIEISGAQLKMGLAYTLGVGVYI